MTLEVLVSAVNQQIRNLAERMHLESDAVIINQTDHFAYEEYKHQNNIIRGYNSVSYTHLTLPTICSV